MEEQNNRKPPPRRRSIFSGPFEEIAQVIWPKNMDEQENTDNQAIERISDASEERADEVIAEAEKEVSDDSNNEDDEMLNNIPTEQMDIEQNDMASIGEYRESCSPSVSQVSVNEDHQEPVNQITEPNYSAYSFSCVRTVRQESVADVTEVKNVEKIKEKSTPPEAVNQQEEEENMDFETGSERDLLTLENEQEQEELERTRLNLFLGINLDTNPNNAADEFNSHINDRVIKTERPSSEASIRQAMPCKTISAECQTDDIQPTATVTTASQTEAETRGQHVQTETRMVADGEVQTENNEKILRDGETQTMRILTLHTWTNTEKVGDAVFQDSGCQTEQAGIYREINRNSVASSEAPQKDTTPQTVAPPPAPQPIINVNCNPTITMPPAPQNNPMAFLPFFEILQGTMARNREEGTKAIEGRKEVQEEQEEEEEEKQTVDPEKDAQVKRLKMKMIMWKRKMVNRRRSLRINLRKKLSVVVEKSKEVEIPVINERTETPTTIALKRTIEQVGNSKDAEGKENGPEKKKSKIGESDEKEQNNMESGSCDDKKRRKFSKSIFAKHPSRKSSSGSSSKKKRAENSDSSASETAQPPRKPENETIGGRGKRNPSGKSDKDDLSDSDEEEIGDENKKSEKDREKKASSTSEIVKKGKEKSNDDESSGSEKEDENESIAARLTKRNVAPKKGGDQSKKKMMSSKAKEVKRRPERKSKKVERDKISKEIPRRSNRIEEARERMPTKKRR